MCRDTIPSWRHWLWYKHTHTEDYTHAHAHARTHTHTHTHTHKTTTKRREWFLRFFNYIWNKSMRKRKTVRNQNRIPNFSSSSRAPERFCPTSTLANRCAPPHTSSKEPIVEFVEQTHLLLLHTPRIGERKIPNNIGSQHYPISDHRYPNEHKKCITHSTNQVRGNGSTA